VCVRGVCPRARSHPALPANTCFCVRTRARVLDAHAGDVQWGLADERVATGGVRRAAAWDFFASVRRVCRVQQRAAPGRAPRCRCAHVDAVVAARALQCPCLLHCLLSALQWCTEQTRRAPPPAGVHGSACVCVHTGPAP